MGEDEGVSDPSEGKPDINPGDIWGDYHPSKPFQRVLVRSWTNKTSGSHANPATCD